MTKRVLCLMGPLALALLIPWTVLALNHPSVSLRDANGADILAPATPGSPAAAYSTSWTCNCHIYQATETHSYHAQLGANELLGWNSWNPDSANPLKSGPLVREQNWVQGPGNVGKWCPSSPRQMARLFGGNSGLSNYSPTAAAFLEVNSLNYAPYDYGNATVFQQQVDLSVPGMMMDCGECHVGGGAMEFVPAANIFQRVPLRRIATTNVNGAGTIPATRFTAFNYFIDIFDVDGDNNRTEALHMDYTRTGVLEMDCFLCHLPGYDFMARKNALRKGKLDASRAIGAGLASANSLVWASTGSPSGYGTTVIYNENLVNEFGRLTIPAAFMNQKLAGKPRTENCAGCHFGAGKAGGRKRGDHWTGDMGYEIHAGLGCLGCHERKDTLYFLGFGGEGNLSADQLAHDPSKGDSPDMTVANPQDYKSAKGCAGCHLGADLDGSGASGYSTMGAPNPTMAHQIYGLLDLICQTGTDGVANASHLDLIDCAACHVRKLSNETWNTGGAMVDATRTDAEGRLYDYLSAYLQRNMNDNLAVFWYKGKMLKSSVLTTMLWKDVAEGYDANADGRSGGQDPLLATHVLGIDGGALTADGSVTPPEVAARAALIESQLNTFNGRTGTPDVRLAFAAVPFRVDHDISPGSFSWGVGGCADCHREGAGFYNGSYQLKGDQLNIAFNASDRAPFARVNGGVDATDFTPLLRDKKDSRSIPLQIADGGTVRAVDRSELLYDSTFVSRPFLSSIASSGAIDFSGNESSWIVKIEERNVATGTVTSRTRKISADVANVAGLLADLQAGTDFTAAFQFTIADNGAGGIRIDAKPGYLIRLNPDSEIAALKLEQTWQPTPVTGTNGRTYAGRAEWVAYLNAIGAPPAANIVNIATTPYGGSGDNVTGATITVPVNTTIYLDATDGGDFTPTYKWTIGDGTGTVLTGRNATYTFTATGTFGVTLTVTDKFGRFGKDYNFVKVAVPTPPGGAAVWTPNDATSTLFDGTLDVSGLPAHTRIYVLWGDFTANTWDNGTADHSVPHTFKALSSKLVDTDGNGTLDAYRYTPSVRVYNGTSLVKTLAATVDIPR